MHHEKIAKTIVFFTLALSFLSCSKNETETPVVPEIVSTISITLDVQGIQPYYIRFIDGYVDLSKVALDKHGKGRIVFAGKNGRNISSQVKKRIDDYKDFEINDGDTIKIYNDNKLAKLYITARKNFANITFPSPYTDSNETGVEMLNHYINDIMPTQQFSFRSQ